MFRRFALILALAGFVATACDVPTEPPSWTQTWQVPADSITVGVAELLPADVTLNADSTAFQADVPGVTMQYTLSELCPSCPTGSVIAPKPAFQETLSSSTPLPEDLVSAMLAGGSVNASFDHTFSFDPLRPSSDPTAERGFITVRITSAGNVVASDSISGEDQGWDSTITLVPDLPIQPGLVEDSFAIELVVYSPAGDETEFSTSDELTLDFGTSTVLASEVTVAASSVAIEPVSTTFNFSGVDSTLVDQVESGAIIFDVMNPFAATGTLDVAFQGSFPTIQRTVSVSQGTYADTVAFSGPEARAILGADGVNVEASGSVSATGGTLTVTPTQRLVLDPVLEIVVLVGSGEENL